MHGLSLVWHQYSSYLDSVWYLIKEYDWFQRHVMHMRSLGKFAIYNVLYVRRKFHLMSCKARNNLDQACRLIHLTLLNGGTAQLMISLMLIFKLNSNMGPNIGMHSSHGFMHHTRKNAV